MRHTIKILLILSALLISIAALIFGISMSLAAINDISLNEVREKYSYTAGTNVFTLASTPAITSGEEASFTVTNNSQNANDTDGGNFFDLIIVPTGGFDITGATITCESANSVDLIDDGFVLRHIELAPSADNSTTSASVTLTVTAAEGAIPEGGINTLQYNAYAVRYNPNNRFVGSRFRLQSVMDEYYHLVDESNTAKSPEAQYVEQEDLLYIYFTSFFTIDETVKINVPAYMNLLDNTVTLNPGDIMIKHGFGGAFAIESITTTNGQGSFTGQDSEITFDTPYAIYLYEQSNAINSNIRVTRTNMGSLVNKDSLGLLESSLLDEAIAYIGSYIPRYIYGDIVLPDEYHNFGIAYSYIINDVAVTPKGNTTRGAGAESTTGSIQATAKYTEDASRIINCPVTVVGTSETALKTAYRDELEAYLRQNAFTYQNSAYVLTHDADIVNLTERFIADSGNTNALSLSILSYDNNVITPHFYVRLYNDAVISSTGLTDERSINGQPITINTADVTDKAVSGLEFVLVDGSWRMRYVIPFTYEYNTDSDISGEYTAPVSETNDITVTVPLSDVEVAYLRRDENSINQNTYKINIADTSGINYSLQPLSDTDIDKYIDKTVGQYYFIASDNSSETESDYTRPLMKLTDSTLSYDGNDIAYGVQGLSYKIYYVNSNDYTAYKNGDVNMPFGTLTAPSNIFVNPNSTFIYETAVGETVTLYDDIIYSKDFSEADNMLLLLVGTIDYTDTNHQDYHVVREIMLPGLGSFDGEQLTTGRTFADFITSMAEDNYMIIESNRNNAYQFKTNNTRVELSISKINGTEMNLYSSIGPDNDGFTVNTFCTSNNSTETEYCKIVEYVDDAYPINNYSCVEIYPEYVPDTDSVVELTVELYQTSGDSEILISTQEYSFTIPGIYHYDSNPDASGNTIRDIWVYMAMLQTYGDFKGYLLASDAQKAMANFDCSEVRLAALAGNTVENAINLTYLVSCGIVDVAPEYNSNDTRSLEGVQYLTGTAAMTFDGVKVKSLEPFAKYEGGTLTSLSMNGCDITQAMLNGSEPYLRPLYKLDRVTNLSLDCNGITSLLSEGEPCIYRNVTTLSLNEQNALTDITGIGKIPYITTLYINNNHIENFAPLLELDDLINVYLSENIYNGEERYYQSDSITEITMYGTTGQVNVPNYVALIHKGVDVYVTDSQKCEIVSSNSSPLVTEASGYKINQMMEYLAVSLNSIIIPDDYWMLSEKPTVIYKQQTSGGTALTVSSLSINTHELLGREHWIVSITDNSTTVYKEFFYTEH